MRTGGGGGLRRMRIIDKEGTPIHPSNSSRFVEIVVFRCDGEVGVDLIWFGLARSSYLCLLTKLVIPLIFYLPLETRLFDRL